MGNRSFLYVVSADDRDGGIEIAEANNNFPMLWQLLLAEGDAASAITDQRVFGDAETDNLATDADQALERLQLLAQCMRQHPRLHEQPLLTLQFEALLSHLRAVVDETRGETDRAVQFSANLDELSWLEDNGSPEGFISRCRDDCNERWRRVGTAIQNGHHALLDEALGIREYGRGFESWAAWAWEFGFGGLHHEYFNLRDTPRDVPFAEFKPEPRTWDDALGEDFERFERAGRWGVRWRADGAAEAREVLAPEWDEISFATYGAVWVRREGLYGYARLRREGIQIDLPPQLDEVWEFHEDTEEGNPHCAVVRRGEYEGLLGADGCWLLEPSVDEIWGFDFGHAPFRLGERQGFIDREGRIAIPADFDDVSSFTPAGLAPVWRDGLVGLLRPDGKFATAPGFDDLEWRGDFRGFLATRANKVGLLQADGSIWIDPKFDELTVLLTRCLIATRLDDLWGLYDWSGQERIAPRFHSLEARFHDDLDFDDDEAIAQLQPWHRQCIVRIRNQVGLIDADGRELVPIAYDGVESFEPQTINGSSLAQQPHLVCIIQRDTSPGKKRGKRGKLRGIYDTAQGCELVPCTWNHVYPTVFDDENWGILVSRDVPAHERERLGDCRTGILNADGSTLFAAEYAWIAKPMSLSGSLWMLAIVRKTLQEAWSENQPVQAVRNEDGHYVWLYRDGSSESHADYLSRRHEQTGDLKAALDLGRALRDGAGVDQDLELARQWLWRATGAESMPGKAPSVWRQFVGVLRNRPQAKLAIPDPQPSRLPRDYRAMYELALMLQNESDGLEQPDTARNWLEFALEHGGRDDGDVLAELGYLLSEGIGGPADRQRGNALYEQAIEFNTGIALHNLALAYQYGWGVEPNLERALDYFRRANQRGDDSCAYHVGVVLAEQGRALGGKERCRKLSEAAYALSGLLYTDIEHSMAACAEYAHICLDPTAKEYSLKRAEELLQHGAEADDLDCVCLLIDALYGKADSELADQEKAAFWTARKTAIEAGNA